VTPGAESGTDGVRLSRNTFAGDFWANFKRWTVKSTRNPFFLFLSLIQPIIFLVLFTQVFGGVATGAINSGEASVSYTTYLVPAIAMQVALAAAASSGIGLVNDMEEGMFEKVLVSPMNRTAVFLGKTASELLLILIQIGIILVLGTVLGGEIATGFAGAIGIMAVGFLFSVWFVSLSNILAVVSRDQETTALGANIIQFPLLFISTAFLPLDALPGWIQTVAGFNPVTYGVDAARALVLGRDVMTVIELNAFGGIWDTLVPAVSVLLVLDVVVGGVAVYVLKSATSSSVR
jgi:ABC-2 type transport system permease protein